MPTPEIQRIAEYLAEHALLLLCLGLVAVAAAFFAAVGLFGLLMRLRPAFARAFGPVLRRLSQASPLRTAVEKARAITAGFLTIHLAFGLIAAAAVLIFVVIAEQVIGDSSLALFDVAFARELRESTTAEMQRLFVWVSLLGSRLVLGLATVVVAVYLWHRDGGPLAVGWIASQAGGVVLNGLLKESFARTRPEFADRFLIATSWSFPSGHAMATFIFCGVAGALLVQRTRSLWLRVAIVTLLLLWCLVMSFSRLYLGVHYVSDVAAGMVAGAAWVAVCLAGFELIRRRLTVPRAPGGMPPSPPRSAPKGRRR
jgi:membrane-associated phospholipid phosphatase